MANETDVVRVERLIAAEPEAIFELLVDPRHHRDIDGSGSVLDPEGPAERLAPGSSFVMSMERNGSAYTMTSTVIAFEDNRKVAWQTRGPGNTSQFGGRIWSYELEPVEGGTLVRETWDITQEGAASVDRVRGMVDQTRIDMAATLERLEQLVTA